MIRFNELKVTEDNKYLIIDVSVEESIYFTNISIDKIIIDNLDTYIETGPSTNPVYTYEKEPFYSNTILATPSDPENRCCVVKEEETETDCLTECLFDENGNLRSIHLVLDKYEVTTSLNSLFFVYVVCSGTVDPSTPCGMDEMTTMATVVNLHPFYRDTMKYTRAIALGDCNVPLEFIDMILRFTAFEVAIRSGNYVRAIEIYNRFFKNHSPIPHAINRCGCNGIVR